MEPLPTYFFFFAPLFSHRPVSYSSFALFHEGKLHISASVRNFLRFFLLRVWCSVHKIHAPCENRCPAYESDKHTHEKTLLFIPQEKAVILTAHYNITLVDLILRQILVVVGIRKCRFRIEQ